MPQINRDKESLYPPGKLSVWFLGSSAVLVGCLIWMLADDFLRPWKTVQAAYFDRAAGVLAIQKEMDEWRLRGGDLEDEAKRTAAVEKLKELADKIAAAERDLEEPAAAKQIAAWQADAVEQQARYDDAVRHIKMDKGTYSAKKYEFDTVVLQHGAESAKAKTLAQELRETGSDQQFWEDKQDAAAAQKQSALYKIEDKRRPLTVLKEERDRVFKEVEKTEKARAGAYANVHENQWRRAPVAEIVGSPIRVEKAVLEFIHEDYNFATSPRVDMCMTCHRGIDREEMSEERVGPLLSWYVHSRLGDRAWKALGGDERWFGSEKVQGLRAWLSGTPSLLDVFPEADLVRAFGGKGDKGGEPEELRRFRERHLGGKSLEEGGRRLLAPFAIRRVEWAHPQLDLMVHADSKHPMGLFGCTTCHEGQGRRLDFVRATHTPDSEAQQEEWKKQYGWVEAEMVDLPMLPKRHVEGQCLKCHMPNVEMRPTLERLDSWKADAKDKQAPKAVDGPQAAADGRWHPEVYELGAETIRRFGCLGCHFVKDFGTTPGFGPELAFDYVENFLKGKPSTRVTAAGSPDFGVARPGGFTAAGLAKVGPDLTHIADKTTRAWAIRWIEAPTAYRIRTRMPAFYRYREHHNFQVVPGPDGKPIEKTIVLDPTTRDLAQIDVELLALTAYLFDGQTHDPTKLSTPPFDRPHDWLEPSRAATYPEPPAGDAANGKKIFYSMNCWGCHVGPDDREGGGLDEPAAKRFSKRRTELPPGPDLTSLGSKVNAKWLYAWLKEPRHYNPVTRMPNQRWRDETTADGKTVTKSADQQRADVVAYLMQFKDAAFEARVAPDPASGWTAEHQEVLVAFYTEWTKTRADPADPEPVATKKRKVAVTEVQAREEAFKAIADGNINRLLVNVGESLIRARGCFACHNIEGFEAAQPIGKELTFEGTEDIHKFDFGLLGHPYKEKNELGKNVEETRWGFIEEKLRMPRVFDLGKFKPRWQDKLRMPKFNLTDDERVAVATVVLGWSRDPLKPQARYSWPDDMKKIHAGRAVVERYGCNQCHTIERRAGVLTAAQLEQGSEAWMLPPNLFGEGNRVDAKWLFNFLKRPHDIRPGVIQRMPMFRMSDEEATALVDYFTTLAGRRDRLTTDLDDAPLDATPYPEAVTLHVKKGTEQKTYTVHSLVEEAKAFFEHRGCVECHLPKGTPGVDPSKGGTAPPFTLAHDRLQRSWMNALLQGPQRQIAGGTKMPDHWSEISKRKQKPGVTLAVDFPEFLVSARAIPEKDRTNDVIAQEQMKTLVRYLKWHYQSDAPPPAAGEK